MTEETLKGTRPFVPVLKNTTQKYWHIEGPSDHYHNERIKNKHPYINITFGHEQFISSLSTDYRTGFPEDDEHSLQRNVEKTNSN